MNMERKTPNPIKEYYIAYIDILGYKAFFKQHRKEIPNFLERIDNAIKRTVSHISVINDSPIFQNFGSIEIKSKIFSDNILVCMETSDKPFELLRILSFIQIISDIQRGFVTDYGLFLRGGIKKGDLSINDDYVFGQGLIDAVEMEEKDALYPRIIIDEAIVKYIFTIEYSQEEYEKVSIIENALKNNQTVSQEDIDYYNNMTCRVKMNNCILDAANKLIWQWDDKLYFINYLHKRIDPIDWFGNDYIDMLKMKLQILSPYDYALISQPLPEQDLYLLQNKQRIEEQLQNYGHVYDSENEDWEKMVKEEEIREYVLKKYIWAMAYHNRFCKLTNKMDYFINSVCNCDSRYLKMVVTVVNKEIET